MWMARTDSRRTSRQDYPRDRRSRWSCSASTSRAFTKLLRRGCQGRGISFVDDVTWFVEGTNIEEVTRGLEACAAESLRWAEGSAVRFETSKTEAVLLSRRRGHGRQRECRPIRVGDQEVHFAREATRWLGVWLDSAPTLRESRRRVLNRARKA